MEVIHCSLFDKAFSLQDKDFFYHITNPVSADYSIINTVCRKASILRDLHIIDYINKLIKNGKNIFIVYGGTHAIMQEPAMRTLL
jgi:hypothetical protein